MHKFITTKLFKVFLISAFLLVLIFLNPQGFFAPAKNILTLALSPFQKVFYSVAIGMENTREFVASIGQLKMENAKLLQENQNLLAENAMLGDVKNENDVLREQLSLIPRGSFDLVPAFVVSQDPNGTGNWLEINKGSSDGIAVGMPVIVSKGILVGKVDEVTNSSAKILLLTNPKSIINVATLQDGTKGVAKGEYGLGVTFDMILQTAAIRVGDDVVTSAIGGDMPKGLYVGTVQEVHSSDDHLFQQAVISLPVQLSKLQVIFVIKGSK